MSEFWIQTYTGRKFDLLVPTPEMVDLDDIAHSQSMTVRFTGHPKFFYSVAEHAFNVSVLVENYARRIGMSAVDGAHVGLEALLHDAAEAYVGDMSRPLKQLLRARDWSPLALDGSSAYDRIEKGIERVIWQKFFGTTEMRNKDLVKQVDVHMLAVEARQCLDGGVRYAWTDHQGATLSYDPEFAIPHLAFWAPETGRRMFVMRARELQEVIEGRA